jgi:hypothetical protein
MEVRAGGEPNEGENLPCGRKLTAAWLKFNPFSGGDASRAAVLRDEVFAAEILHALGIDLE